MQTSQYLVGQGLHLLLRAPGVRGDEVGNQLIGQTGLSANAVEVVVQPLEEREGRLAHEPQHALLGVLGGDLQPPRGVVADDGFEIGRVVEQVVADAAPDECFFYPFHGADLFVEGEQRPVVVVEVGADLRMETRGPAALRAERSVAPSHAVHVGRRGPDVGEIALERGHADDPFDFGEDRALAARVYELALMGRDGAERAAPEAAAVDVDRMLDHLPGGDVALAAVARMGRSLVGEVERVVELLGRKDGVGRRHDDMAVAHGFDQRRHGLHEIALGLDDGEVLAEGPLVAHALLEGMQPDCRCGIEPLDVLAVCEECHLADLAQQLGVVSVAHGACDLLHDAFAHAVDKQVGARLDEHRGEEAVAPVVIVREPSQRGFDASDDDRDVGIEPFEDLRVDRRRTVGAESRLSAGGVGVVVAQAQVGRVVVDHRIHRSCRDAEEEPRGPEFCEVPQVVPPVGLRDDRHAIPFGFEQASHDRGAEGRMVDVGVAREEDDVELVPSAFADLLDGRRQKHGGAIFRGLRIRCGGRRRVRLWRRAAGRGRGGSRRGAPRRSDA